MQERSNFLPFKAIILAAGQGKRLGKLAEGVPKPMIMIEGKAILERNLEWLRSYGIQDVYINLHHLPDVIKGHFGSGGRWGVTIQYSYEPELLGTAGAVRKIIEDYWNRSRTEPFLVAYGDNLFEFDLAEITSSYEKTKAATIALIEKDDVNESGIVLLDKDARVIKFIEKPKKDELISRLVNAGLYVLTPDVLDYIPAKKPADFGKDVFPEMIRNNVRIFGVIVKGNLIAVDTPFLYKQIVLTGKGKN